jgi:hypothetical protein
MRQLLWSQPRVVVEALSFQKARAKASSQLVLHVRLPYAPSSFSWIYIIWNSLCRIKGRGRRRFIHGLQHYILLRRFAPSHQREVRIYEVWKCPLLTKWPRAMASLLVPELQTLSEPVLVKILVPQYPRQPRELRLHSKLSRVELLTL